MQPQYGRVAAGAAAVTAVAGAAGYWLLTGPVSSRVPSPSCADGVAECALQVDTVGALFLGMLFLALTQVLVLATVVGLAAVVTGVLLVRQWPDRTAARVTAGVLVLTPPLGVTAAVAAIAFLHFLA